MDNEQTPDLISLTDEQMEQIVLKKYFTDINYFTIINEFCESRFFQNKKLQKIINILKKYYQKYEKMPTDDILKIIFQKFEKQELGTGNALKREYETFTNLNIEQDEEYIKENILKFIKHKSAYYSFMDHIDGVTIKGDVSDCLSDFQKILSISFNDDLGFDYFKEHDIHRKNMANPEFKIPSGYKQIDDVTYGGFPKAGKSMIVIAAQPGLGKSLFMSNLAVNFLQQDLFTVIITLEMSEEMYGNRIDAHLSSLNINKLRYNLDALGEKITDFHHLHSQSKLLIKEFPPNTVSCIHIQNYIDKISTLGRKPDVIFVDYINLLKANSGNNRQGMYERIGDVCRELRALTYRYKCPLITATQLNRCLTLDAKVKIFDTKTLNPRQIEIKDVKARDKILSNNGYNNVKKVWTTTKQIVYKITTKSGKTIKCSNKHIFPTENGEKSIISGLKIGDKLIVE